MTYSHKIRRNDYRIMYFIIDSIFFFKGHWLHKLRSYTFTSSRIEILLFVYFYEKTLVCTIFSYLVSKIAHLSLQNTKQSWGRSFNPVSFVRMPNTLNLTTPNIFFTLLFLFLYLFLIPTDFFINQLSFFSLFLFFLLKRNILYYLVAIPNTDEFFFLSFSQFFC